jgi:hypothetical protein
MSNHFTLNFQSQQIVLAILLTSLALLISWWSYRNVGGISYAKRYILIGLRTLGIALIGFLLLEPLFTVFGHKITGDKLGVLVDLSSSMNIVEAGSQRWNKAESAFTEVMPSNIQTRFFGFSDTLVSLDRIPDSIAFDGQATNLSLGLGLSLIESNDDIGALLILTDGANNIGEDPIRTAAMLNLPVYSLVVGNIISRKDISIAKLNYQPIAYINTETSIQVEYGATGFAGQFAQLEIRDGKKTLVSKRVILPADGALASEEFVLNMPEEGVKLLEASITAFPDESYKDNNSRHFRIKFLKDKIRILLMSSHLDWEFSFLKRALESDPHIEVKTALGDRQGNFDAGDLPENPDGWANQDLVIVINSGAGALRSRINEMNAAIKARTGFLYIAGADSRVTQVNSWKEILPIDIDNRFNQIPGEYWPRPLAVPRAKAILDIEEMDWDKQPPLRYLLAPVILKPSSWAVMDVSGLKGERWPAVVAGNYGQGKTMVMLGYPWWNRQFKPTSDPLEIKRIRQFWGNLVRWLVTRDDLEKFNVSTDKAVYKLGEPITFTATVFDDNYNLVSGARVMLMITDSAGTKRELQLAPEQPGRYIGEYGTPSAGSYTFGAAAVSEKDTLGIKQGTFVVETTSLEMENPSANYALMRQISEITGGKSYMVEDFNQFPQNLKLKLRKSEVFSEHRPLNAIYVLMLAIVLFSAEWAIRKFSQLP